VHRILFHIGDYPIYSFGVMVAVGVLCATFVVARLAHFVGMTREQVTEGVVTIVVLGVFFARVAYILQDPGFFVAHPAELLNFRGGGMSWHGGIFGFILGTWIAARREGVPFADFLDLGSVGMMVGLAVGRVGCLMNGCCYGRESHLPWAIPLPDEHAGHIVMRHPSPLYEMILALAAVVFLAWWLRHRRFHGEVFFGFLLTYSAIRFAVEFFRESALIGAGLSLAQWVSLGLMLLGAAVILYRRSGSAPLPTTS